MKELKSNLLNEVYSYKTGYFIGSISSLLIGTYIGFKLGLKQIKKYDNQHGNYNYNPNNFKFVLKTFGYATCLTIGGFTIGISLFSITTGVKSASELVDWMNRNLLTEETRKIRREQYEKDNKALKNMTLNEEVQYFSNEFIKQIPSEDNISINNDINNNNKTNC